MDICGQGILAGQGVCVPTTLTTPIWYLDAENNLVTGERVATRTCNPDVSTVTYLNDAGGTIAAPAVVPVEYTVSAQQEKLVALETAGNATLANILLATDGMEALETAGNATLANILLAADGMEALETAGNATLANILLATDGLETLIAATNALLTTANGFVIGGITPVSLAPAAMRAQVSTARPANVTAYTAGDVVGGAISFPSMGLVGGHIMLTSVDVRMDIAALPSGMTNLRLYLYTATPPSALADNAVWDLPAGDRTSFIGYIDLGTPVDLGSTLFAQVDAINKQCKLGAAQTALYGYLVTTTEFTPAANSEVYVTTLRAVAL